MSRFIVEIRLESDWTAENLRDAILDGMGYPLSVEREPYRVRVTPAEWQPIETAPKTGEWVILGWSGSDNALTGRWHEDCGWHSGDFVDLSHDPDGQPTHWLPFSLPPYSRS